MLTQFAAVLAAEQREGNLQADEFVARIDAHIRDLETLKAWVLDSARLRSQAIGSLIGDEAPAPAAEVAPEMPASDPAPEADTEKVAA